MNEANEIQAVSDASTPGKQLADDASQAGGFQVGSCPGIMTGLATLPPDSMLTEAALAGALGVTSRTIRRMSGRFELPPPVRLAGRAIWIAGRVREHIQARAERAAREAERAAAKIHALSV